MADRPDEMAVIVEKWVSGLLDAYEPLAELRAIIRGEAFAMPVELFPFATVFCTSAAETTEGGHGRDTGPTLSRRYDGYVTVETLNADAPALIVEDPKSRQLLVPSHSDCQRFAGAAYAALFDATGDGQGNLDGLLVTADEREKSSDLILNGIRFGVSARRDSVSDNGTFTFHVTTRRSDFP